LAKEGLNSSSKLLTKNILKDKPNPTFSRIFQGAASLLCATGWEGDKIKVGEQHVVPLLSDSEE
jgi:hypothetical protein